MKPDKAQNSKAPYRSVFRRLERLGDIALPRHELDKTPASATELGERVHEALRMQRRGFQLQLDSFRIEDPGATEQELKDRFFHWLHSESDYIPKGLSRSHRFDHLIEPNHDRQ